MENSIMIYCFDLDGTICKTQGGDYRTALPYRKRIEQINKLHAEGHRIIIESARGSVTGLNMHSLTVSQLNDWGVRYDTVRTGAKIYADYYVDDKGISTDEFFK